MSLLSVLDEASLRQESLAPSIGSAERDWADNGWPKETLLRRFEEGVKRGRGAPGWKAAGPAGSGLLALELRGPMDEVIHVVLDPAARRVAFKLKGKSFVSGQDSLSSAAGLLALHSHQAGEGVRAMQNPLDLRKGLWQGEAPRAAAAMASGLAVFHPKAGEDWELAWERDFERLYARCEQEPDPFGAMARVRAQYRGGSEQKMVQWIKEEVEAGKNCVIASEPARRVAFGARGGQIHAAIPLRADGSVNDHRPIMAVKGQLDEGGAFKQEGAVMRFYNAEAFANFVSSAQSVELNAYPAPALNVDALPRLEARREALAAQKPPAASARGPVA